MWLTLVAAPAVVVNVIVIKISLNSFHTKISYNHLITVGSAITHLLYSIIHSNHLAMRRGINYKQIHMPWNNYLYCQQERSDCLAIFSLCIDHCVEATNGCASVPLIDMNGVHASWKGDLNMVLSDINCVTSIKVLQITCIITCTVTVNLGA